VQQSMLVADSQDQQAIDAIVAQTRVLLTTAGPFALWQCACGCLRSVQTHYVDISGETPWVRTLIDRYHAQAAPMARASFPAVALILSHPIGTHLVVRHLQRELDAPASR